MTSPLRRFPLSSVALPPADFDPEEVRRVTAEVLARPEYRTARPGLIDRLWAALLEFIGRLLERVAGAGGQSLVGTLVVVGVLALVALLLFRFLRRVRRDRSVELALSGAIGRSPAEWEAEASAHERAGRWREALRCRYRLVIARLAERGLVEELPGRTTGEYLKEATSADPGLGPDLRTITTAFERVWYGNRPVDESDLVGVRAVGERLAARAGRGSGELAGVSAGLPPTPPAP